MAIKQGLGPFADPGRVLYPTLPIRGAKVVIGLRWGDL